MATITMLRDQEGYLFIHDDVGHYWRYLYYPKREALRLFKRRFGYRYKKVTVIDSVNCKEKGGDDETD